MIVVWVELARDQVGVLLFLVWLVLPPAYVVVLGRRYVREVREYAQVAVWARDEVRLIREDMEAGTHDHDVGR